MRRYWVYDDVIKRGLAYSREHQLDLGTEIALVSLADITSEPSVIPPQHMIDAIAQAAKQGQQWPKNMPLPILACQGPYCVTMDGNHRIKAARKAGLVEIPAIVASLSTWEALEPRIEQEDVIPYDDFIAILAEAGSKDVRKNLRIEAKARKEYG